MTKRNITVRNGENLAVKVFGPYEEIRVDGGVLFMWDDNGLLEKAFRIPEGYTLDFEDEVHEQGGFSY